MKTILTLLWRSLFIAFHALFMADIQDMGGLVWMRIL